MFIKKTQAEINAMTDAEAEVYAREKEANDTAVQKTTIEKAVSDSEATQKEKFDAELKKVKAIADDAVEQVAKLKEQGIASKVKDNAIKTALLENDVKIKEFSKTKTGTLEIVVKANQNPNDIDSGYDYAEFDKNTIEKPFRKFTILDIFKRRKVSTEYLKYSEEDVVTRDAQVVVACSTSEHNTKKSWVTRTLQMFKIRDYVDVCEDMINDYDFVEAQIRKLVEQSVKAKEESEILMGSGDISSINATASEFAPANVLAPFNGANGFQSPTLAELTGAMAAQIVTFGQENKWQPNVILMNYADKIRFMHLKNANNDYLLPNFVLTNGGVLNGMQIVTSPLVAPNTLYVMDSTRGEILDREEISITFARENKDNFEREVVTVKAVERVQFHIPFIDRDAFMKCSDIADALDAITKP